MLHDEIGALLISPAVSPTLTLALRPKAVNSIAELIQKKPCQRYFQRELLRGVLKLLTPALATPKRNTNILDYNPHNPLYNPSFHFIFHFLFHLILHYSSFHFLFHYPYILEAALGRGGGRVEGGGYNELHGRQLIHVT